MSNKTLRNWSIGTVKIPLGSNWSLTHVKLRIIFHKRITFQVVLNPMWFTNLFVHDVIRVMLAELKGTIPLGLTNTL